MPYFREETPNSNTSQRFFQRGLLEDVGIKDDEYAVGE